MTNALEFVSPKMAVEMLASARNVRNCSPTWVAYMAMLLRRGEFVPTPDGIVFDQHGMSANGRHRATAITKTGIGAWMYVWRNVPDDVIAAMDQGRKRSISAVLGDDPRVIEPLNEAARIALSTRQVPPTVIEQLRDTEVGNASRAIVEYCGKAAKVFSSAPVKLAAILHMVGGGRLDYILPVYADMVHGRVADLPPVARSFLNQVFSGTAYGTMNGRYDLLARGLVVFDESRKDSARIQISDTARQDAADTVRHVIREHINGGW